MKMPTLTCNRCGKEDTMMVDAPHLDDPRQYCVECYAILFPPGWTNEQEIKTKSDSIPYWEAEAAPDLESEIEEKVFCPYCGSEHTFFLASIYCVTPENEFSLMSCDNCAHAFWYPDLPVINADNADDWFDASYEPES